MTDAPPARLRARLARGLPPVALGAAVLGVLLHLGPRDRLPVLRTVYYALPAPAIAALALLGGAGWVWRRRRGPGLAGLAFGAAAAGVWLPASLGPGPSPAPAGRRTWSVAMWNTARATDPAALEVLRAWDPDVVCLVESPRDVGSLAAALPGRRQVFQRQGLAVLVREGIGALGPTVLVHLRHVGRAARLHLDLEGQRLTLFLVDLASNPLRNRAPAFAALEEHLQATTGPVVLLGDWNTPRGSIHFDGWRARGMTQAFERAGEGLAETWPWPLPLLTLDQAWGRGVTFTRAQHRWKPVSDHRAVWVELAVDP